MTSTAPTLAGALADHRAGRLASAIAQYRDLLARQPGHPQASHLLGFALLQSGASAAAEAPLRACLRRAPATAVAWTHLGMALRELRRPAESAKAFRRALLLAPAQTDAQQAFAQQNAAPQAASRTVTLAPLQASSWHLLGLALTRPDQPAERSRRAVACFRRAALLNPADVPTMVDLSHALRTRRDPAAGRDAARRALRIRPASSAARVALSAALYDIDAIRQSMTAARAAAVIDPATAEAYGNLAQCDYRAGRFDRALRHGGLARLIRPADPQILANLSTYHLALGDLGPGWALFRHRPARREIARRRWLPPAAWTGGPADRLLVLAEQGLGDELLFASCWEDLAALVRQGRLRSVRVEVDGRLWPLAARTFPELGWIDRDRGPAAGAENPDPGFAPTAWIAAGDLPSLFRRRNADFPAAPQPLLADRARVAAFRDWLQAEAPGRLRLGLCWRSGLLTQDRVKHYPHIQDCRPLFVDPGTRIVVLQYDDCAAELAEITSAGCVQPLIPPGLDRRDDLDGMAALIVALDGVLSAETAVLALAGAVGSPSIGFGLGRNWVGLGADGSPWHPSVTRLHRRDDEDWTGLMRRVAEAAATLQPPRAG